MARRTYQQKQDDIANPVYYAFGVGVTKFRKIPRDQLTAEQKTAYSEALRTAVLSKQRQALQRELPSIGANCVSHTFLPGCYIAKDGRWVADGTIGKAVREQHARALDAYVDSVRRNRTEGEWQQMYDAAMKEKRAASLAIAA